MKLLPLKDAKIMKGKEKQLEVNEGMKLASKIDALRATFQKEQSDLIKFRDENVKKILEEIKKYSTEKSVLEEDIRSLEERRMQALIPLDKEKQELKEREKELNNVDRQLVAEHKRLRELEKTLIDKKKALDKDADLNERIINRNANLLKKIEEDKRLTDSILDDTNRVRDKLDKEVQTKSSELKTRETEIASQERDIKIKTDLLVIKESDLNKIRIQLDDQRKTLERALKRCL